MHFLLIALNLMARMWFTYLSILFSRIEHLELDIVEKLEKTIFGFIEPEIAIFTTPNSDFNVLLKGLDGKFRHYDHKFEWSRREFLEWYVLKDFQTDFLRH